MPETVVRIYNINTESIIIATIKTPLGEVTFEGDARIDGVNGTGAPVRENFAGSVGSKTKALLPTGSVRETIDGLEVSCLDVAVPLVMVRATDVGKTGHESKSELDADATLIARLESVRREAGRLMGMGDVSKFVVPKPILVAPARNGGTIAARDFVPYNCHATFSVTGSMALATACILPGTLAHEIAGLESMDLQTVKIEHPQGVMEIEAAGHMDNDRFTLDEATLIRTCRKLMEGVVCIPASVWSQQTLTTEAAQ